MQISHQIQFNFDLKISKYCLPIYKFDKFCQLPFTKCLTPSVPKLHYPNFIIILLSSKFYIKGIEILVNNLAPLLPILFVSQFIYNLHNCNYFKLGNCIFVNCLTANDVILLLP